MSDSSGLKLDDSIDSSSTRGLEDKVDYQPAQPAPMPNLTVISPSNSTPLRAPGFSFTLTLNLKKPQIALERPIPRSSSQDLGFDVELGSQRDFEEASTDQDSDSDSDSDSDESDADLEEDSNDEEFVDPVALRAEREETRGDSFLNCRACGYTFDYSRLSLWVPSYRRVPRRSLQMPNENTHPQLVRCPGCDSENCMACEKSPHDECCSFARARVVWHTLCAVDDAVVQYRKQSPWNKKNTERLDAAVIHALNTLLEHLPTDSRAPFGYGDLLRKSMLLDQVAVTIGNMTAENRFDTLCLQSWAFLNMLCQRGDLFGLLFEDRLQFLRNMSPGVRVLGFPISFFSVQRTYDADRYAPQTYSVWSLIHQACENAQEFLSAGSRLNDAWPAVMLARSIVNLHDDLGKKQPAPLPELVSFAQAHQLSSFEARLEDMYRVDGTKYGAVHGNIRMAPSFSHMKKRGVEEGQDHNEGVVEAKRMKTGSE
ncbi:hypothetical protein DSL72_009355 [Monilinia vaccinii-corymbosi]|uniref:Uncharacterized protein n=1 Tax=Monilinia vaccinii-corymbosi TaxID=61207 RepID=A0A8A3PQY8_9HELO|nr:hypothetical protein DSL72_009355 [Monilinia vaccinii-corymbosi]